MANQTIQMTPATYNNRYQRDTRRSRACASRNSPFGGGQPRTHLRLSRVTSCRLQPVAVAITRYMSVRR